MIDSPSKGTLSDFTSLGTIKKNNDPLCEVFGEITRAFNPKIVYNYFLGIKKFYLTMCTGTLDRRNPSKVIFP